MESVLLQGDVTCGEAVNKTKKGIEQDASSSSWSRGVVSSSGR